jgi:hypothetical protein
MSKAAVQIVSRRFNHHRFMVMLVVAGIILLGVRASIGSAFQHGVFGSACRSHVLGDPFVHPSTYITYRITSNGPANPVYLVELGATQPHGQQGFDSTPLLTLHLPIDPHATC